MVKNIKLGFQIFLLSTIMVFFQNCTDSEFNSEELASTENAQVFDGEPKEESEDVITSEPVREPAKEGESAVQEVVIDLNGELERECEIKLQTDPARLSFYIEKPGNIQSKSFYLINSGVDRVINLKITGFVFQSGAEGKFQVRDFICDKLEPQGKCLVNVDFTSEQVGSFDAKMRLSGGCELIK